MNHAGCSFLEFRSSQASQLYELLRANDLLEKDEVEAIIHALVDISESVETVYNILLPDIVNGSNINIKEKLWSIREEFRHIAYHIEDAKLTDL